MKHDVIPPLNLLLPQNIEHYEERAITTFVVKIASRCNIACTYCYMYEHPDQTWREQPAVMSEETIELLAVRLQEYIQEKTPKQLLVVAHGGEPLLIGAKGLHAFFSKLKEKTDGLDTHVGFGIQTNGILVTDDIVEVFQEFEVRAGVSIDGPPEWNDIYRVDKQGRGTFNRVIAGIDKLRHPAHGESVFGGILTVANPDIEPNYLLSFLTDFSVPYFDVLLPDYNHNTYPYEKYPKGTFGRWMIKLFDLWMTKEEYKQIEIRTFKTFMKLFLGGQSGYDSFGAFSGGVIVVETDGTYHALDVLKTAFHGATKTGKSLASHSIKVLEADLAVVALSNKRFVAPQKCLACQLFDICGGGYLPHRYKDVTGFFQESVYCDDLILIISHIYKTLSQELSSVIG